MMSSYVCRQCCARLLKRAASARSPQWQPRATFISLRNRVQEQVSEAEPTNSPNGAQNKELKGHSELGTNTMRRPGRYSRHLQQHAQRKGTLVQEDSSIQAAPIQSGIWEQPFSRRAPRSLAVDEGTYARSIEASLREGDVETAWRLFTSSYTSRDCEALANPSVSDVPLLNKGKIFTMLLNAVNKAFCKGSKDISVTPTAVLFKYEQLGIARPELWGRNTITYLTHQAIFIAYSKAAGAESQNALASLYSELLSLWRLFFQCKGASNDPLQSINPDWQLPDANSLTVFRESRHFGLRLQQYHPKCTSNPELQFSAVYLFTVFETLKELHLEMQAAPFLQLLTHCLSGSRVSSIFKHTDQSKDFRSLSPEYQNKIIDSIENAPQQAMRHIGMNSTQLGVEGDVDPASNLEAFYLKRMARAIRSQSHSGTLDRLWDEVERAYTTSHGKPSIPLRIYNSFLSGFMELYQSGRSVEIWNHMVTHGVKPEPATWVALLEGCEKARDLKGLNAIWARMEKAGIEPDSYAWTTRVHAMVSLRSIKEGLAAMDEMGKKWLAAEHLIKESSQKGSRKSTPKARNNHTKPSIEVVNGAMSALVQLHHSAMRHEKRIDHAQKLLQWSREFELKPDVRTFNILIQLYLGAHDYESTARILRHMEEQGIEADIATHTMLISAAFASQKFDSLSEAEQADRIIKLFADLEAKGLKLNAFVYSTAIDRLLKRYSNFTAARMVLDHMRSRNITPSPQIYTSLITHYFQQQPPDISSVDAMVHQIFTSDRVNTDKILFDRIIEGYAAHGEIGNMMSVLTRMSKHGKLPGWTALTAVVQALVREGDMDRARRVVKEVEMGEGVASKGITGGQNFRSAFFAAVRELGIALD